MNWIQIAIGVAMLFVLVPFSRYLTSAIPGFNRPVIFRNETIFAFVNLMTMIA